MTLTLFFAALSGVAMTLLFAFNPTLSFWWRLPVWLGLYVGMGLVHLIVIITCILTLPRSASLRSWVRLTLDWVLTLIGYRIHLTGTEKLPRVPFLLVCNHRSAFDPLCAIAVMVQSPIFVAKPSVFRIPLIGTIMRRLGFMPIDRENARNAVSTIKQAAALIREEGLCVGIYPEGTRSKTGELLPFHAGSFKIAAMADCPVVVAAIRYEKRGLWGKRVHLQIADVMDTDFVSANTTATMADRAKAAITAVL